MNTMRLGLLIGLMACLLVVPGALARPAARPHAGPCTPGAGYDPACDVDRDNDVDIFDIQLTAGRWGTNGAYLADGWLLTGNAGTTHGTNFLGTTDNQALELRVNGSRVLLLSPGLGPNLTGGYSGNTITAGVQGGTISGGGTNMAPNRVTDHYGTVGGGQANTAGDNNADFTTAMMATVGGGENNTASGWRSTVGGGLNNVTSSDKATVAGGAANLASGVRSTVGGGESHEATGAQSTIGGGFNNTANGYDATVAGGAGNSAAGEAATIAGGEFNTASAQRATVGGGFQNNASGMRSTIVGGENNTAGGFAATVAGGTFNEAVGENSFAAGYRAKANHDNAFVWADGQLLDFASVASDSFSVRAANGTRIFGSGTDYGLRVQNNGTGDGIRAVATTSNGNPWAALYATNSGTSPAIYASSSGTNSAYFVQDIYVGGSCTGCEVVYVARNRGDAALEVGDVVEAAGIETPLTGTTDAVVAVRRSSGQSQAVLGVVQSRAIVTRSEKDGQVQEDAARTSGAIEPGDALFVVVHGLAWVKVDPAGGPVVVNQRLTPAGLPGAVRPLRSRQIEGMLVTEGTPVVGVALGGVDEGSGLVAVMVNR